MTPIENELLQVARIVRPHGLRGEVKIVEQPSGSGAWRAVVEVFIGGSPGAARRFGLLRVRGAGRSLIMSLEGIETIDGAREFSGLGIFVRRDDLPPPEEGSYYVDDLLGMRVEDETGRSLGVLTEIFDNGVYDIYVVIGEAGEIMLPIVEGVVLSLDVSAGTMVVRPPAGLLDGDID
ncbi:MAG TPA: ribosome maturation factor RimM [Myxococcota bacterium]|nr:ribosome maturation factor RimM [Myxococcota bacterium]